MALADYEKLSELFMANIVIMNPGAETEAKTEAEKYWKAFSEVLLDFIKSYMEVQTEMKNLTDLPIDVLQTGQGAKIGEVAITESAKSNNVAFEGW